MSHSATDAIMKSGFRNPIQHSNFVDGMYSFPELIESYGFLPLLPLTLVHLGAAVAFSFSLTK